MPQAGDTAHSEITAGHTQAIAARKKMTPILVCAHGQVRYSSPCCARVAEDLHRYPLCLVFTLFRR